MALLVFGKIYTYNGQIVQLSGGYTAENFSDFKGSQARLIVKNGEVVIEYDIIFEKEVEKYKEKAVVWLYHVSKDFINNFLFAQEIRSNKCLIFLPEYFQKSDGTKAQLLWNILDNINIQIDEDKFTRALAENPKFRDGVNDFHIGLLDMTTSPAHFYRVVDTLAQFVIRKDGKLDKLTEWSDFKMKIGLNREERTELEKLTMVATPYRHGTRIGPINDYVQFLRISKIIIIKTYQYIIKNQPQALPQTGNRLS